MSTLSYAHDARSPLGRWLIHRIERATGMRVLDARYSRARRRVARGDSVWDTAVRALDLTVRVGHGDLDNVPSRGPLVVVANHPFGLVDGLVLCHLVARVRSDFKILVHAAVRQIEEVAPFALPIDFSASPQALRTNLDSRAEAIRLLRSGHSVLVFPGAGVSTAPRPGLPAVDAEWKTFTAKLVQASSATVLPVYFSGQNSWLFHLASQVHPNLRLGLLAHEARRRMGSEVTVRIGEAVPSQAFDGLGRRQLMATLRQLTYALGSRPAERPPGSAVLPAQRQAA